MLFCSLASLLLSFFFLNATPPTEIYTLSLHDALPISRTLEPLATIDRPATVGHVAISPDARDRKSTRLNSSHLGISYAVFCLKKKNMTTVSGKTINSMNSTTDRHHSDNMTYSATQTQD